MKRKEITNALTYAAKCVLAVVFMVLYISGAVLKALGWCAIGNIPGAREEFSDILP